MDLDCWELDRMDSARGASVQGELDRKTWDRRGQITGTRIDMASDWGNSDPGDQNRGTRLIATQIAGIQTAGTQIAGPSSQELKS